MKLDGLSAKTGRFGRVSVKMSGKILGEPEPYLDLDRHIRTPGIISTSVLSVDQTRIR